MDAKWHVYPELEGEEAVVHLPEFALVLGTVRRESGAKRVFVDRERHIHLHEPNFSSVYELFFDLCRRLTDVPGAERSLVVGELDEGELRPGLAAVRIATDAQVGSRSTEPFALPDLLGRFEVAKKEREARRGLPPDRFGAAGVERRAGKASIERGCRGRLMRSSIP